MNRRTPGSTRGRWSAASDVYKEQVCQGVWYESIDRPAYKHLSHAQAKLAVKLCNEIIAGQVDLSQLNLQSLTWRGKR